MLGEFKKFMASCPCFVFLSVHNREDMYSYQFVYLARCTVYSSQFVCVCVALAMYERPPVRKSPIWLRHAAILYIRLKLKQDGDVCFGERRTYLVECVC
uniref:Uncharacterized protein n=1 Tax=Triticum urartu TaxID=4572 RepID=A0A8R7PEX1_TRIUA